VIQLKWSKYMMWHWSKNFHNNSFTLHNEQQVLHLKFKKNWLPIFNKSYVFCYKLMSNGEYHINASIVQCLVLWTALSNLSYITVLLNLSGTAYLVQSLTISASLLPKIISSCRFMIEKYCHIDFRFKKCNTSVPFGLFYCLKKSFTVFNLQR